ncbi:hypothetical protein G5714_004044 [Xyrichtys novacula]|uniref:Uncharacterized protein n=1 Tax=Xyrichtys novacula TaxID=13765 RepID=A0AAV1HAF9_XYRNO|nr:hypothetical protein G5714_004044 [Xyrichtys novacula]
MEVGEAAGHKSGNRTREETEEEKEEEEAAPPELAGTSQEVHSFFASCVEDEEREDSGGEVESSGRQLVMQYLSSNPKTLGLTLLGVWKEISSAVARRRWQSQQQALPQSTRSVLLGD